MISQARLVMDTSNSLQSKRIPACNLCLKEVKDEHKRYLVDGRGQFNVLSELKFWILTWQIGVITFVECA